MATVSVTFSEAWVNLASDPSQCVHVGRRPGSGANTSITGEVRQGASGRLRTILLEGIIGRPKLSFRTNDHALLATLRGWVGQTVCLRDELGRLDWCVFFEVPEPDLEMGWVDVDLTLQTVTYSPAV